MRRGLSGAAIAACAAWMLCLSAVGNAAAAAYSGLYVFGDSLSDAGNVYSASTVKEPVSPPYSDGRFTNGNLWIQDLATSLGLGPVTPSLRGGNDFAFGGAQTGPTQANPYDISNPAYPAYSVIDLPAQLAAFNTAIGTGTNATSGALFTLWIGANDLDALVANVLVPDVTKDPSLLGNPSQIMALATPDLTAAISNITTFVGDLNKDGMQNLLALNVPDLSKTPDAIAATGGNATLLSLIQSLTEDFNAQLSQALTGLAQTDGFALTQAGIFSAMDQVVADPSAYDLTNVTDPCWTGNFTDPNSGTVCSDPSQYLFWDGLHPTAAGHQLVANVALAALVPEPGSAALLLAGVAGIVLIRRRRG